MQTRVLYVDADERARERVERNYSKSEGLVVDTVENIYQAVGKLGKVYGLLAASYFDDCFVALRLLSSSNPEMQTAILSNNKKIRATARKIGIPNLPRNPLIGSLDKIIASFKDGGLRSLA